MKILRLKVTNHSAIADIDITLRNHLVLVGPNECGKTTLLELLDGVTAGSLAQLHSLISSLSIRDPANPLQVTVVFSDFTPDEDAALADQILIPLDESEPKTLSVRLTAAIDSANDEVAIERGFVKPGLPVKASMDALRSIGWAYVPASRSPDRELGFGQRSAVRMLLGGVDLGDSESEIIEAIASLHSAIDTSEGVDGLRTDIAAALRDLLPRDVKKEDIVIRLPKADDVDPLADVDVHLEDSAGEDRSLRHQSDGVRAMSTVAVQLLARGAASIIAVDEPEIHLHPRAQAQLARRLNDASGQRIVATHSPAVLERFSPQDVLALTGTECRQLAADEFANDPKTAEHWWTSSTLEPITSRSTILVEGIADRLLIEAVAEALGHNLDRKGVCVSEVDGAGNFAAAIRLFGDAGFGVPLSGLVDEAEAGDVAKAFDVNIASLASEGFQIAVADLEGECLRCLGVADHAALLVASGLFTEKFILQQTGASDIDSIEYDAYLEFCGRRKLKVKVAIGLAASMTRDAAAKLTRLVSVVDSALEAADAS